MASRNCLISKAKSPHQQHQKPKNKCHARNTSTKTTTMTTKMQWMRRGRMMMEFSVCVTILFPSSSSCCSRFFHSFIFFILIDLQFIATFKLQHYVQLKFFTYCRFLMNGLQNRCAEVAPIQNTLISMVSPIYLNILHLFYKFVQLFPW